MSAKKIKKIVGDEIWDSYFTFTFERNPWDKMVSSYHFKKKTNKMPNPFPFSFLKHTPYIFRYWMKFKNTLSKLINNIKENTFFLYLYKVMSQHKYFKTNNTDYDFKEWIKIALKNPFRQPINYPLYTIDGEIVVDFVGKFENLKKDMNYILEKISLPRSGLPREKTTFRNKKKHYRFYYNKETKKLVEKIYKKEIKLFGYKF